MKRITWAFVFATGLLWTGFIGYSIAKALT